MEENGINEKVSMIANRATSSVNTFITEFPDVTVFDLMEYVKLFTVYGAKVIAGSSLKDGKHPNVRTVINDLHESAIECLESLQAVNPELTDDYEWPTESAEEGEEDIEPEQTE